MDIPPPKRREISVQLLYLLNESSHFEDGSINYFTALFQVSKKKAAGLIQYARDIFYKKDLLDEHIKRNSEGYEFDRISKVDLAILRVVVFELLEGQIPIEVAIAEAIRVAKKFSSYGSGKYLHAMIDSIYKGVEHERKVVF